jgi:hypothetical protein
MKTASVRSLIRTALALLAAAFVLNLASVRAATAPNVILVMPDDVGYGDYACLGNPILRTPSVDAFK